MFTVTALGHQGWLIGAVETHVLIDPILTPHFTRMPLSAHTVYPPRRVDLAAFPPIAAVLLSHEHADHLDFVSLQLLDRRTRIYLSAHASDAARRVLSSLGFTVLALSPGASCAIGDLEVIPLAPRGIAQAGSNELDVVPLIVRDRYGHGSFFTTVDLPGDPALAREARRHLDRPCVWTDANSGFDRGLHFDGRTREQDPVGETARRAAERYASLFADWGHPQAVFVTDNGLTLGADLARLNAHVFEVSNAALIAALQRLLPGHAFRSATPGATLEFRDGELVASREAQPFLAVDADAAMPPRGGAPIGEHERADFSPATGRRALPASDRPRLEQALAALGRFLFSRVTYVGLFQLMAARDHDPAVKPTVALALRGGEHGALEVWEFVPQRCSFVRAACDDPRQRYVAGVEVWASDLLAVLCFEAAPEDVFHFGRKRLWNAAAAVFHCDLDTEIELFAHPLRAPAEGEALYRRLLDPAAQPVLQGPTDGAPRAAASVGPLPRRAPVQRPMPSSLTTRPAAPSHTTGEPAADAAPPVDEALRALFARAIAEASSGRWALASASRQDGGIRVAIALPGDAAMHLDVGPASDAKRFYRRVGAFAYRYGPAAIRGELLETLDRVIALVAAVVRARGGVD